MIIRNPATYHHRFTPPQLPHWTDHAACHGQPTDIWFPHPADETGRETAIRVCDACPVATNCLAWALKAEAGVGAQYRYGIFGGLTGVQRARLDRKKVA